MQLVLDDHLLRARLQGALPEAAAALRAPGEPLWTTRRFQDRLRRALDRLAGVEGVHRRAIPPELRRAVLARLEAAALVVAAGPLALEMAAVEATTDYHVPVWVEALATARLTGAILVVSEANFGGQMPLRFRPAADAAGVDFRVVAT